MHGEALHNALLSLHLVGVFLLLFGLSIQVVALYCVRRATRVEQLRGALFGGRAIGKIMPTATLAILIGGAWLSFLSDPDYSWHSPWIIVAVIVFILISANGARNVGERLAKIGKEAFVASPGKLTPRLEQMCNDPVMHYSGWVGTGIIFSFIVLMVAKPGWIGSVVTVLVGAAAGLAANYLVARPQTSAPGTINPKRGRPISAR